MILQPSRRGFLLGLGALIAAPAIVRAELIMPVKKWIEHKPSTKFPFKFTRYHTNEYYVGQVVTLDIWDIKARTVKTETMVVIAVVGLEVTVDGGPTIGSLADDA